MKKIILILLLSAPLSLYAFDFGLTIENTTSVLTEVNNVFFQKDKITLWTLFDLGDNAAITIEGFYRINFIQAPYHAYSLDRFELAVDFPVLDAAVPYYFGFALGRIRATDFSGYVFSHALDGVRLVWKNAFTNTEAVAGFTGLLFKGESTLALSIADQNYAPPDLALVPPRFVAMLHHNFPEVFAYQTLNLAVVGQIDMQADENLIQPGPAAVPDYSNGGRIDTLYAGLGLNGPLFPNFYWEAFFYFEFGRTLSYINAAEYRYTPIYAFLTGVEFEWYFPDFLKSKLTLDVIVASGDGDYGNYLEGNTDIYSLQFVPITRPTIGLVFAQQLTNLIVSKLEFAVTPVPGAGRNERDFLQVSLAALVFFRASQSDVSDSRGLNSGSNHYYLGSEADLVTVWKPLSDLGMELALGLFLPNNYSDESAFSPTGRTVEFLARFQLSLEI